MPDTSPHNFGYLSPFNLSNIDSIPDDIVGVYSIWYQRNLCIYIGSTTTQNIKLRLTQHWTHTHNDRLSRWISAMGKELSFSYISTESKVAEDIEFCLIKRINPLTNVIRKN